MTMIRSHVDEIIADLHQPQAEYGVLGVPYERAAQHEVMDAATSATVAGAFDFGARQSTLPLSSVWTDGSMPIEAATILTDISGAQSGKPTIPELVAAPAPGAQGGEKLELPSNAINVDRATPVEIDESYYVNVSQQLASLQPESVDQIREMARAAVMRNVDAGIVGAMEAGGTAAADIATAFAGFDGSVWRPTHLVIPPSKITDPVVDQATTAGLEVVIDSAATAVMVVDRRATQGWMSTMTAASREPSLLGGQVAVSVLAHVAVAAAGVQVAPLA